MNARLGAGCILALASLTVAACVPDSVSDVPASTSAPSTIATTTSGGEPGSREDCVPSGGSAWTSEITERATALQSPGSGRPGVDAVVYPHPPYDGRPWSQWGQGIVTANGLFLSAIGDHLGADGNSYVFSYDAATDTLTQIADVLDLTDHRPGDWGFGKVHGQMVSDGCGFVYFSTYWGSRRGLVFTPGYQGDLLFRLDPSVRTIEEVGVIFPGHGVASLAAAAGSDLLYAEAANPVGEKVGSFIALRPDTGEVVFKDSNASHGGYRSIAVDADGRAYITWDDTGLARFDPATNTLTPLGIQMPGGVLRAVTVPDPEGVIFGVTRDPAVFFSLTPDGTIATLGPARGYTTSLALAPDGGRFYYVPDAHGTSWEQGAPLIAVDTATGEQEVIVELAPLVEAALGLRLGGSYDVVADPNGDRVFIGFNAGDPASRDSFGEIVLVVVTLP